MAPRSSSTSKKRSVGAYLDGADLPMAATPTPQKRRRVSTKSPSSRTPRAGTKAQPLLLTDDDDDTRNTPSKKRRTKSSPASEKRLRRFRAHPPGSFLQKLDRARTQRMIVLSRTRTSPISESIDIVGSTGNIYTVSIDQTPSCTCPDSRKGNECKHKVYALHTVLRAQEHLVYQLALLTGELEDIFTKAPPIPTDTVSPSDADPSTKSNRKPIESDSECPICYMEMSSGGTEELVWCKAACGNNMHKTCFDQWAASQRGQTVKCVYCRTPWEMDKNDLVKAQRQGTINEEGYVNVADQFGMSGLRDYSSYHSRWVRQQLGMGW